MSGLFSAQINPNKLPELLIKSELSRSPSWELYPYKFTAMWEDVEKKSQKTVKIKSRNVVEADTTSLCLLKKPTYRQHFRGWRSFNYAKRFSVLNQESCQCNPHSNRPLWALRPPFYLASSLHPPHKPSPQLLIGRRPADGNKKTRKMVSNRIENCAIWFPKS